MYGLANKPWQLFYQFNSVMNIHDSILINVTILDY